MIANEYGKYIDFERSVKIDTFICYFCNKQIKKFPFMLVKERSKENPYKQTDKYAHKECFEVAKRIKEKEEKNK